MKRDTVVFKKTAEGWLVEKQEPDPRQVLAELEEILESRGRRVEEWLASGREIRGEIYETKYARDADEICCNQDASDKIDYSHLHQPIHRPKWENLF